MLTIQPVNPFSLGKNVDPAQGEEFGHWRPPPSTATSSLIAIASRGLVGLPYEPNHE
jgi:hypothetical protein